MTAADDILEHATTDDQNTRMLNALRAVATTVQELSRWSTNRLDPIDLSRLPQSMKSDAETAAETLTTILAERLNTLSTNT